MAGGASVTLPALSASATVSTGNSSASLSYTATITPVFVVPGGAVQDSSGNYNILVGQGCTATLTGIPTGTGWSTIYQWSVTGTTFQSWTVTQNLSTTPPTSSTALVAGPGSLNIAQPHWYWNDLGPKPTPETINCTATVTPPAGQGSPFSVTATKSVIVNLPGWYANETPGYMQVNTKGPLQEGFALYAGPSAGQNGGINWSANVMSSALFTSGVLELVQCVTPSMSYITYTGVGVPGMTHNDPENGEFGSDTHYPYGWLTQGSYMPPYIPVPYTAYDAPSIVLSSWIASAKMQHQFDDYLMFMPPSNDSKWVPLGIDSWSTNGNATVPTTDNWADYVTQNGSDAAGTVSASSTSFTASNTFPAWTRVDVFPAF